MKQSTPENPTKTPLKILIVGPPGSRKTTFALQFPEPHVLDCDNNLVGPETYLRKGPLPNLKYTLDTIRYDDNGKELEIEDCYNRVVDKLKLFKTDKAYQQRTTVILDSLSHVNEFIIRWVLKLQNKSKKSYEMEARDWSPFKSFAYNLLVGRLEETGKAIICTCHEVKLTENDLGNIMTQRVIGYEPYFQGRVGDIIGAFFSDVWRMEVKQGPGGTLITELQTARHPKCECLKNSLNMPSTIDVSKGFSAVEPYLKGRI